MKPTHANVEATWQLENDFVLLSLFIYFLFKRKQRGVGRDNKHSLFVAEEVAIIKCLESCCAYCACGVMR